MSAPEKITIARTVKWLEPTPTINAAGVSYTYPASEGHTYTYTFINSSGKLEVTGTAQNDDYLFSIAPADTSALTAGVYKWQSTISDGTDTYDVDDGFTEFITSFADETTYDYRSHARTVLDAIEATIEGRASAAQLSITVEGKAIQYWSADDLMKFHARYKALVTAEEIQAGTKKRNVIKIEFTNS